MDQVITCTECDRALDPDNITWLVLRISDNSYHPLTPAQTWFGGSDDQGAFPFGTRCAKKVSV